MMFFETESGKYQKIVGDETSKGRTSKVHEEVSKVLKWMEVYAKEQKDWEEEERLKGPG